MTLSLYTLSFVVLFLSLSLSQYIFPPPCNNNLCRTNPPEKKTVVNNDANKCYSFEFYENTKLIKFRFFFYCFVWTRLSKCVCIFLRMYDDDDDNNNGVAIKRTRFSGTVGFSSCCANVCRARSNRRLADEDDELSEVQPGTHFFSFVRSL